MRFAFTGKTVRRLFLTTVITITALTAPSAFALVCGDSEPDPGETCDDGNTSAGDGCSAVCQIEPGFVCTPAIAGTDDPPVPPIPSVCTYAAACDMDSDGDIDRDDIRAISNSRGQSVAPGDLGDFNADGEITRRDVKECTKLI